MTLVMPTFFETKKYLRILTGKEHPKIKLQPLRKIRKIFNNIDISVVGTSN